jgi:hypothetical protein
MTPFNPPEAVGFQKIGSSAMKWVNHPIGWRRHDNDEAAAVAGIEAAGFVAETGG